MTNNNEVKTVPPEVASFLTQYHEQTTLLAEARRANEDNNHLIETLYDQIDGYRKIIEELSAKADHYMRLTVEQRTHFAAAQAIMREAEKCFATGLYRNNGAAPKEALQVVADDINNNTEVKEIPGFLTDANRQERLTDLKGRINEDDLKGEPDTNPIPVAKLPKGKGGWPVQNGNAAK